MKQYALINVSKTSMPHCGHVYINNMCNSKIKTAAINFYVI